MTSAAAPAGRTLSPAVRRVALTAHVVSSVGWLGSVAAFLALAIVGVSGTDAESVRGVYVAMSPVTRYVIVPLCAATLVTGLVQSLGTHWGLVRHYWVVTKLVLTVLSTLVLLLHTQPIHSLADAARRAPLGPGDERGVRVQLLVDAAAAIVVLVAAAALSVFKPRGITPHGWRVEHRRRGRGGTSSV